MLYYRITRSDTIKSEENGLSGVEAELELEPESLKIRRLRSPGYRSSTSAPTGLGILFMCAKTYFHNDFCIPINFHQSRASIKSNLFDRR